MDVRDEYICPVNTPPILYTTSSLKRGGGGLIFENAISLEYKPPLPKVLCERYVHFQSSCLHKDTVTKAFYLKQLIQTDML